MTTHEMMFEPKEPLWKQLKTVLDRHDLEGSKTYEGITLNETDGLMADMGDLGLIVEVRNAEGELFYRAATDDDTEEVMLVLQRWVNELLASAERRNARDN
jgi:hypothetical protein